MKRIFPFILTVLILLTFVSCKKEKSAAITPNLRHTFPKVTTEPGYNTDVKTKTVTESEPESKTETTSQVEPTTKPLEIIVTKNKDNIVVTRGDSYKKIIEHNGTKVTGVQEIITCASNREATSKKTELASKNSDDLKSIDVQDRYVVITYTDDYAFNEYYGLTIDEIVQANKPAS